MKISRGGIKFNGKTKAEPLVVCHPWDNPSILNGVKIPGGGLKFHGGNPKVNPF